MSMRFSPEKTSWAFRPIAAGTPNSLPPRQQGRSTNSHANYERIPPDLEAAHKASLASRSGTALGMANAPHQRSKRFLIRSQGLR